MKICAKNTAVKPVYWAHLRKWPHGQVMEYDVSEEEHAAILADARLHVEEAPVPVLVKQMQSDHPPALDDAAARLEKSFDEERPASSKKYKGK